MDLKEAQQLNSKYVMNTYGRNALLPVKGEGCWIWDSEGKKYLDCVAGIAVNALGQCHPSITQAISRQAGQLMHCSNIYLIENQIRLAQLLVEKSCCDKAFFCNSGAEANEAAIKLARKWAKLKYGPEKYEIITAKQSFHGRTLAAITATGQPKYQKDFEPLPAGFTYVSYNDLDELKEAIGPHTCAIMLEAIQGEGGVHPATEEYLQGAAALCSELGLLLIIDEVQTGIGRTGKLFAYEHYGIQPDIITLAKALGNGVPIGAMLAKDSAAAAFVPGNHASTFGGNPLSCAAALAALQVMEEQKIVEQAAANGRYLMELLMQLKENFKSVTDVRGKGLMAGVELDRPAAEVIGKCREKGLLVLGAGPNVIRFVPPLIISKEELRLAASIAEQALTEMEEGEC